MSSGRRQYPFHLIEPKWQHYWDEQQTFRAWNPGETVPATHPFAQRHGADSMTAPGKTPPKYYILDMFPYPSGAGLHVGHPEGYTATDILARYQRARGRHVLHPMGWDAFGLPAEQYAIKTGQHPRKTTEENIATFKRQIKSLGFSYDWSREVDTTDPNYFKWTQWIFLKLYNSWFNPETNRAEPIETFKYRNDILEDMVKNLSASPKEAERVLGESAKKELELARRAFPDSKRLAYVTEAPVWWCEQLGTVLANEEVVDGKSEVGGFPVVRKPMRQWMLRITNYAERLLSDLETIDWTPSLKEMQRNWIGRSEGAEVRFRLVGRDWSADKDLIVFTTRPDTLFGATYMVLAPEHKLVDQITTLDQRNAVEQYKADVAKKSDLERTELAKEKTGVFTGAYAINPVNQEKIPVWIADYVLATYGTGAIMAVPAHDERDFEFVKTYKTALEKIAPKNADQEPDPSWVSARELKVKVVVLSKDKTGDVPFCDDGFAIASPPNHFAHGTPDFTPPDINGLPTLEAKKKITAWLESKRLGKRTVNYKLRDWLFSRQRYWGEPFPIIWKRDASGNLYHEALPESALPVLPPKLDDYKPTPDGQPPLARAQDWVNLPDGSRRETNTMPQWAGSCWYYLRYLDAKNPTAFVSKDAENYWMAAQELEGPKGSSLKASAAATLQPLNASTHPGVDLYVGGTEHAVLHLLYARFWHKVLFDLGYVSTPEPFFKLVNQGIILGEDNQKMSKSRGNVINPDDILKEYGADAFRLYEMFMGPLEMSKPWSTRGVEGVYRFLGRVWRLFVDEQSETEFEQAETTAETQRRGELLNILKLSSSIKDVPAIPAQLKTLHATIKKVTEDLDGLRFNTAISAMMVFVNEAMTWETKPVSVLRDFLILLAPFAPHITEELWQKLHSSFVIRHASLSYAEWPKFDPALLVEDALEIPVQVNGKLRDVIKVPANADNPTLEAAARASEKVKSFIDGKAVKKIIVVPRKLINIVVG